MAYINNSKLKAKLAYIFHYSDLSRPQRDVFDNACRLAGGGRGLSRSRILRLLQTLDTCHISAITPSCLINPQISTTHNRPPQGLLHFKPNA